MRDAVNAAGLGVAVSIVAGLIAVSVRLMLPESYKHWSMGVALGVITTVILTLLAVKKTMRGRTIAVASVATLGWLPFISLCIAVDTEPLVSSGDRVRCGTGLLGMFILSPCVVAGMLLGSAVVALFVRSRSLDGARRWGAVCSLVLVGVASLVAIARMGRPDPDGYVGFLPVAGTLDVGQSFVLADGSRVTFEEHDIPPKANEPNHEKICVLDRIEGGSYRDSRCGPLTMHRDAKIGLWILDVSGHEPLAFLEREKRVRDIYASDVGRSIGPPRVWTLGAVLGLVLGVVLFARGMRFDARGAALEGIDGSLQRDGWVTHAAGPPIRLTGVAPHVAGPVFVQLHAGARTTYRDAQEVLVESWQRGTLEDARAALRERATAFYALAMTSALLTSAPLLLSGFGGSR